MPILGPAFNELFQVTHRLSESGQHVGIESGQLVGIEVSTCRFNLRL
jgi:hypothetical protein